MGQIKERKRFAPTPEFELQVTQCLVGCHIYMYLMTQVLKNYAGYVDCKCIKFTNDITEFHCQVDILWTGSA